MKLGGEVQLGEQGPGPGGHASMTSARGLELRVQTPTDERIIPVLQISAQRWCVTSRPFASWYAESILVLFFWFSHCIVFFWPSSTPSPQHGAGLLAGNPGQFPSPKEFPTAPILFALSHQWQAEFSRSAAFSYNSCGLFDLFVDHKEITLWQVRLRRRRCPRSWMEQLLGRSDPSTGQLISKLVGGCKDLLFSISYMDIWDNPSHWRTHIFQDG